MSLVATEWLENNINKVKIIDSSWHLPISNRDAYKEYTKEHIFVGISLKETDFGNPKVTETNLEKTFDHIHHSCGMIKKPLKILFKNFEDVSKSLSLNLNLSPQNLSNLSYYKICSYYEKLIK